MKIKIPDTFMGKPIEGSMQRVLDGIKDGTLPPIPPQPPEQLPQVKAKIQLSDYIAIPNTKTLIIRNEICKGKDWEETHFALDADGLFMPPPKLFRQYFNSVVDAFNKKTNLFYGNGNPLSFDEVEDLYKYLTTNHKHGCGTWLDAYFPAGSGFNNLDMRTEHKVVNGKLQPGRILSLDECLSEEGYVLITDMNNQGFPMKKSDRNYEQGKNIYFFPPMNDCVGGFEADPVWAGFGCGWDPTVTDSAIGVFACAEGASAPVKVP